MTAAQVRIVIGTGARSGQFSTIDRDQNGGIPLDIAYPDPVDGEETGAGVDIAVARVEPGSTGSTTYRLIQTENNPGGRLMYR
jgi:hypothetical protein